MRVPKFRVRTLMIAVAVLGIAFGGIAGLQRMNQRMQRFHALAREHRHREIVNRLTVQGLVMQGAASPGVERHRVLTEYHKALKLKYEYAASHPWLPVSSDPPEPE